MTKKDREKKGLLGEKIFEEETFLEAAVWWTQFYAKILGEEAAGLADSFRVSLASTSYRLLEAIDGERGLTLLPYRYAQPIKIAIITKLIGGDQ